MFRKHIVTGTVLAIALASGAFLAGWATGAESGKPEEDEAAKLKWIEENEEAHSELYSNFAEMALLSIESRSGEVRASARMYFDSWAWKDYTGLRGSITTAKAIRPYLQEVDVRGKKAVRALEIVGMLGSAADIVIPDALGLAEERPGLSTLVYNALGKTGCQAGTVPALVEAFKKASTKRLDYLTSARALARLRYRGIIPDLLKTIESKGKPRRYAAEALGIYECLPDDAEKAIVAALRKEKEATIRAYLLTALGKCGKWSDAAESHIAKGLVSDNKAVRKAAIGATRCRGDLKVELIEALLKLTTTTGVPVPLRNDARNAIMTLPGSRIVDVLQDIVVKGSNSRFEAAKALMLHSQEGAERAAKLVADGKFLVPKGVTSAIPRRIAYMKPLRRLILSALRDEMAAPIAIRKILVHDLYLEAYIKPLEVIASSDEFSDATRDRAIKAIDKIKEANRAAENKRTEKRDAHPSR
jgi:hypothetical protein